MIVVDASALMAIVRGEPEQEQFARRIGEDGAARISAAGYLEAAMVSEGQYGAPGRALFLETFAALERLGLDVVPFDRAQADLAFEAFRRFGRGRHPARLNFGDCMAYALAKSLAAPLLFKGDDFALTDLPSAV